MSRDPHKLRAFQLADSLVVQIYAETKAFPDDERYGLRAQIRRAAVSSAANIVEGSARQSIREYLNFVNIATGSAFEVRYLVGLAARLGFIAASKANPLEERYTILAKSLVNLLTSLEGQVVSLSSQRKTSSFSKQLR